MLAEMSVHGGINTESGVSLTIVCNQGSLPIKQKIRKARQYKALRILIYD